MRVMYNLSGDGQFIELLVRCIMHYGVAFILFGPCES